FGMLDSDEFAAGARLCRAGGSNTQSNVGTGRSSCRLRHDRTRQDRPQRGGPWGNQAFPHVQLPRVQNATTNAAVTTALAVVTGKRTFHPNDISWSYRRRGSVARSQTKTTMNAESLIRNQIGPGSHGPLQPPRKRVT